MFETDKAMFDLHQKMAINAMSMNWSFIEKKDRSIVPLLNVINKHPNINTRWSCSGHYRETKDPVDSNGYLVMSIRNTASHDLLDFFTLALHHENCC